jgi:hypothetical protein
MIGKKQLCNKDNDKSSVTHTDSSQEFYCTWRFTYELALGFNVLNIQS